MVKIIQIYDKNTTDFSKNGRVLNDTLSCFAAEELNGSYELELEHPLDARLKWQELVNGNIVKADGQLYRLYHRQKTLKGIKVNARHIFYDLLDNFLEDVRPTNLNGAGALDWTLTHTQYTHPFSSMSDVVTVATKYFIRKNVVEAIMGSDGIINTWGGEIERDNFTIKLLQARGLDRGVLVAYGKNIQGIEETLDIDGICTRLMPVGKDGLLLTEKYIDSPYINNFPNPKIRVVEFNDCEDETSLRAAAQKYMLDNKIDIPQFNYKVDFLELSKTEEYKNYAVLERVYLGDTVTIKHSKLNINLKAKVIKITKNVLTNRIEKVELGSFKQNLATGINNSIKNVKTEIDKTKSALQIAIENATELLTTALGGYVVKRNGELLIMDTEDINTAEKVWRWNQGGLGYSENGYNGPYRTAITADGHIVADFMDTGTLNADLVSIANNLVQINSNGITIKEGGLTLTASDGSVVGWFGSTGGGFSKLLVNELIADNILTLQTDNVTLYVNGSTGNDNAAGTSGAPLKTITKALSRINKIFKSGVLCYIYVYGVCSENVLVENFMGDGYLGIIMDSDSTLNGSIKNAGCSCFVDIKGGRDGWDSSVLGALIQPPVSKPAIESINSRFVRVYGCRTKVSNADGFVWDGCNGSAIFNDISGTLTGANRSAISAVNGAQVTMWNNRGSDNWFAWAAEWGGAIIATDGCGVPNNSYGIGIGTGGRSLVGTTTAGESSDPSVRPPTQIYTTQWVATQTDSYRPSGWRTDTNNIYQGEWNGNGIHTGFMIFDSAAIRAALSGATINNVRIFMTRYNGGGASAAEPLHWRGHGYDATGGGTAISSDFGYCGALGWGQAGWIGLPIDVGDQLKDDIIRGLALNDGSSNYSIYTGMPVLEITYTK